MATSTIKRPIQDTGWLWLKTGVAYRKVNGIVYVNIENLQSTKTSGTEILAVLPEGFRPTINIQPFMRRSGTFVSAWVINNGEINVSAIAGSGLYAGSIIFPAGNV